jgi:steroid delta-isomerase-like uncharacterized protein
VEVVEAFAAGWSAHDPDRFAAMFTDDAVYEDLPLGFVSRGRDEIRQYMRDWLASSADVVMHPVSTFGDEHHGGIEWVFTGTHSGELAGIPPTGKAFELRGASVLDLREGGIGGCRDYWDIGALRRELFG